MSAPPWIFLFGVFAVTWIGGLVYQRVWRRRSDLTPTGFGAFLAPVVLGAASLAPGVSGHTVAAFVVLAAATAIYWLDDLRELSAKLRLLISFVTGVTSCAAILWGVQDWPLWELSAVCVAAGVMNVVLTNIVNFYDGADLNLATVIALTGITILLFSKAETFISTSTAASLAFIAPFAIMNSAPRTLYLGDSGSFVFASFFTLLVITYYRGGGEVDALAALPMALPAFDTFFVFAVRLSHHHDLLSRNYLHLYQKLKHRYEGFGYLAPQGANLILGLGATLLLMSFGLPKPAAVAVAGTIVTISVYFASRKLFLPGDEIAQNPT